MSRSGHGVVSEGGRQRLSLCIVIRFLEQRRPHALQRATNDLTVHDHRVDDGAAVFGNHVIQYFDRSEIRVDGDDRRVSGIGKRTVIRFGTKPGYGFYPAGIDTVRQFFRISVPDPRNFGEWNTAGWTRDSRTENFGLGQIALQQMRADFPDAFA